MLLWSFRKLKGGKSERICKQQTLDNVSESWAWAVILLIFRVHWECSPCHFEYDLILHLEDVDKEYDYAWEKIADVKPVLREQYKNSPMAKHHPSWYWRNVPKDVAKKIYMIYFMGKICKRKTISKMSFRPRRTWIQSRRMHALHWQRVGSRCPLTWEHHQSAEQSQQARAVFESILPARSLLLISSKRLITCI